VDDDLICEASKIMESFNTSNVKKVKDDGKRWRKNFQNEEEFH